MKFVSMLIISFLLTGNAWGQLFWGEKVNVGAGHALTYVKMSKKKPVEIGVALSAEALMSLPQMMTEYVLPIPSQLTLSPYKHITLGWNPAGHASDEVYNKAHFDIHFYMISQEERKRVACTGADAAICMQQPATEYIASHYGPTSAGVPGKGWHWVDLLAPEFNGGIFTRTFLYGYYEGEPIFLEPKVTLEFLLSKTTSETEVRLPAKFPVESVLYPAGYKISFDAEMNLHKIVLKDFIDEGP